MVFFPEKIPIKNGELELAAVTNLFNYFMPVINYDAGDVANTWVYFIDLVKDYDYHPITPIQDGIDNFIKWYCEFYGL